MAYRPEMVPPSAYVSALHPTMTVVTSLAPTVPVAGPPNVHICICGGNAGWLVTVTV